MIRKVSFLIAMAVLLTTASFAQTFSTTLTGAAEVPGPGDPDGSGFAVVSIEGTTIHYTLLVQRINPPTGAHIHRGAAGVSGEIVVNLAPVFSGGNASGSVTASQDVINQILANPAGFYVNVHTSDFPGGALRGQLSGAPVGGGSETQYLPVSINSPGVNNTFFVSDVRLVNSGSSDASVTLEFFPASLTGLSGPAKTATVTVEAGEEEILDDIVVQDFQSSGLGAIRVVADESIHAVIRNVNDLRASGGGVLGYAYQGKELSDAKTSGTLAFLSNASAADRAAGIGFRTNVGYFNPTASPVNATFNAYAADGTLLGSRSVTVQPLQMFQQGAFQLVSSVPEANQAQADFYMTYTTSGPIFVWATIADNKNGDGVFID